MFRLLSCIFLICLFLFFGSICAFALDEITITTYYPSPYGVYNELQLYPHASPITACDNAHKGTMYYDSDVDLVYVCKGPVAGWSPVTTAPSAALPGLNRVVKVFDLMTWQTCTISVQNGIVVGSANCS